MSVPPVHPHTPKNAGRPFALGIALNLGFVLVEALFGWRAGSLALLADAGHNLSDVAGLVLAWAGMFAVRLRPDARHTYGWQRASILASFANAVLLLVVMGALALEAVQRLGAPIPVAGGTVMVVAGVGVLINGTTALLFMSGRQHDLNMRGAFLHMAADTLVSLGVVASGAVYLWTQWTWLDPVVTLLVVAVIVLGTWSLFRKSLHLMFDGVPEAVELAEVDGFLRALPGVEDVHDLHVWAMSTSRIALTAHLVLRPGVPGDALLATVAPELRKRFHISHSTIQLETACVDEGCAPPVPNRRG